MLRSTSGLDWEQAYITGQHLTYWELSTASPELTSPLELVAQRHPGASVVDLGCGTGGDLLLAASYGLEVTGVDISATACRLAEERLSALGHRGRFLIEDITAGLSIASDSVDLALDRGCLHHLGDEDRESYAAEVARITRKGGTVFIRGCIHDLFPFKAVNLETYQTYFENYFLLESCTPAPMKTDAVTLDASLMTLVRR